MEEVCHCDKKQFFRDYIYGGRVIDFNRADGDRVNLLPGTTYTVSQQGADVVIDTGGGRMVLVGVQLSSLDAGWIFGA